jgi:hypothetical protein
VDWKLYARTIGHYVSSIEADTNTNFSILFDISKSMKFSSGGVPSSNTARSWSVSRLPRDQAARSLRHRHLRRGHRHARPAVGQAFRHGAAHARPRQAERPGRLSAPLYKMAEHFKRRGILLLISDFYDDPDAILDAIKPLKFLGNDLIVFHALDL